MRKTDWGQFCKVIEAADEAIKSPKRSQQALAIMFEVLKEYSIEQVRGAVYEHMKSSVYAVKPADIASRIGGNDADRSALGWQTLLRALREYGFYESIRFPEPAYHYAIEQMGGWQKVCEDLGPLSDREIHFREKGFRELFEIGCRVASWNDEPGKVKVVPHVRGFFENDNRSKGLLKHLPEVIDMASGERTAQTALPDRDVIALPSVRLKRLTEAV